MSEEAQTVEATPPMVTVAGTAASRGYAAGQVFVYRPDDVQSVPEYEIAPERVPEELNRFHVARIETRAQIEELVAQLGEHGGNAAAVFANHLEILDDDSICSAVERRIREERVNVETALRRTVQKFREMFGRMKDPYLRERVRDVDDIERRFLRVLLGCAGNAFSQITEPVIVVAGDLAPSDTVALPRGLILGFATDRGSATSHVALLARVLGIPAVVGLGSIVTRVKPGDEVLLDGTNGTVTVNPDVRTCAEFARLVRRERELLALLAEDRTRAGATKDGAPVQFCANAQPGVPMGGLAAFGAQGVGLYRTEYLWLGGEHMPTEEEQAAVYSEAVRAVAAMGPEARVVFRALDLGGDKLMRGVRWNEANPFLGSRSIRWLFEHRDVFRAQVRAILRASAVGPSAVMWPMIATVQELREANEELRRAKEDLRAEGIAFDERIPVGCMIEIPSAALCADQLAREVDFFSIGTNDLVQYTLAADRGNEHVAYLYQPTNPAVIRLIDMTVTAATAAGIPVAVCGETASDPVLGTLWVGLGVRELSMSASYVPVLRKVLRALTIGEIREMAEMARAQCADHSAAEIYAACRSYIISKIPQLEEIQSFFTAV
ncbi:MAG: phosphoenolpyruvate--protein phosphotransferase [Kiritimatiellia bacterium]